MDERNLPNLGDGKMIPENLTGREHFTIYVHQKKFKPVNDVRGDRAENERFHRIIPAEN